MWVPGMELRSSDMMASAYSLSATSQAAAWFPVFKVSASQKSINQIKKNQEENSSLWYNMGENLKDIMGTEMSQSQKSDAENLQYKVQGRIKFVQTEQNGAGRD